MIGMPRISSPAVWGKLPDRGDYVRYRDNGQEIEEWRAWLDKQPWLYKVADLPAQEEQDWLRMTPDFGQGGPTLHELPWSFVLRPGVLPFSGKDWLIGVMSVSEDNIGRSYPLVIYQSANQPWLQRYLGAPLGWLYWLAQLASRHVEPGGNKENNLTEQLDRLWTIHSPKSGGWFSRARADDRPACRELTGQWEIADDGLRGVHYLPWASWPQLVWTPSEAQGWFWQQDRLGGFLDARCLGKGVWES